MTPETSHSHWYRALNLAERTAPPGGAPRPAAAPCSERAARRLGQWRSLPAFGAEGSFERRLAADGLTEALLLRLLDETEAELAGRVGTPAWMGALDGVLDAPPGDEAPRGGWPATGLLALVAPLLRQGHERLRSGMREIAGRVGAAPATTEGLELLFLRGLAYRLLEMAERTLVLELNVARLRGALRGDTPEARFQSFAARIGGADARLELFREYPVLARQLRGALESWAECTLEFVERLCRDWPALREAYSPAADPGALVGLEAAAGDRHRGGRSVMIAEFASGLRVVYKPRPLAVDLHFQALLAWMNGRGQDPPLRTLRLLDRGDYGWCEFVAHGRCGSVEEVKRFYRRQGSYLALLHLLHATDFHFENVIAAGEHPMLVDLESLFHPHLAPARGAADDPAALALRTSVLRVRMLPTRSWADGASAGIDVSGLGAPEGQMSPRPVQFWEDYGTDAMRMDRKPQRIDGAANRPVLDGGGVDVAKFRSDIVGGFEAAYRLLAAHRGELGAAGGPLAAFADDDVRVLLRPTYLYEVLRRESFHPDMLRDALDRDRFFDRLWAGVEQAPHLASVVAAERRDLWRDDIPLFTSHPSSRDLWTGGGAPVAGFFARSGMELVLQRLGEMGEADLQRQRWIIDASFAALSIGGEGAPLPSYAWREPARAAPPERFLDMARAVGDRLGELAIRDGAGASWIGLKAVHDRERYWSLSSLGLDLYGGLPGVALFLAHLGDATGEERYARLAREALATVLRQVESGRPGLTGVGAFSGWGGVIYSLAHLERLCGHPGAGRVAERLVAGLPAQIAEDRRLDVMGGAAGCLAALLALGRARPSDATLEAAIRCGDRLLEAGRRMDAGTGWVTPLGPLPLAGFSHGAAGIAWALAALWGATGMERFRDAALAGIEYERSLYSAEAENWADLREEPAPGISAWCHGAVGVGIGRVAMLPHLDTPATRAEIATALRRTAAGGLGANHSLCHGDLGDLELLLLARAAGVDEGADVERLGTGVLHGMRDAGWLCGVPLGVETPGLMTGLAGIGYGLLRLARPASVPSLLTLEPPAGAGPAATPARRPRRAGLPVQL